MSTESLTYADPADRLGTTQEGGSPNCIFGRYVKGYAGPRLRHCVWRLSRARERRSLGRRVSQSPCPRAKSQNGRRAAP